MGWDRLGWGRGRDSGWRSDTQLVGDGHDYFEDGHEGRDLAEVAAADDLRVHLQAAVVVAPGHAAADLVQTAEDAGSKLRGGRRGGEKEEEEEKIRVKNVILSM